ncbi:MAG: hypothetical protein IRY94_02505 [Rhodospirillaceae bacterium]|nr:hypothetical protein [Rhodospirillaceae bacterium]
MRGPAAMIPVIDAAPLFGPEGAARRAADRAVMEAATDAGFMMLTGLEGHAPVGAAARAALLRVFDLDEAGKRRLWRRKFDPSHANVYRGWFPLQDGVPTYKEGIDIGPDVLRGPPEGTGNDPLTEPTRRS